MGLRKVREGRPIGHNRFISDSLVDNSEIWRTKGCIQKPLLGCPWK